MNCVDIYRFIVSNIDAGLILDNISCSRIHIRNAIKEINQNDKTKVKRIYWQFNKTEGIEIDFYKAGEQVEDFFYVYNCAIMGDEPSIPIQESFEEDVRSKLKSPSSAIFTYNEQRYSPTEKRFYLYGWVEAQNSFSAMVRTDFVITLLPCNDEDYCDWYEGVYYSWKFN